MDKPVETEEQQIRRVAKQIQDILVENKMAMTPTISIQRAKEKLPLETPPPSKLIVPGDGANLLGDADFMQP
jgi:hypothetical protein